MVSDSEDLFKFAAAALEAAKDAEITPEDGEVVEGAYVIDQLPLGYYVVEEVDTEIPVSALVLDTTTPDATVDIKADVVEVDKSIVGAEDVDYNNAAIGDTVDFVIESDVPSMVGYDTYYFIVHDTMAKGLSYDEESLTITIGNMPGGIALEECDCNDEQHNGATHDLNYWYTETVTTDNVTGETTIKIVFNNFIQYAANKGDKITISYSATVDEDAVIGEAGNENKAQIQYSNNPNISNTGVNEPDEPVDPDDPNYKDPTGVTPESTTYTYVTGVEIVKKDAESGDRLAEAQFEITGTALNTVLVETDEFVELPELGDGNPTYWKLKSGEYTTTNPNTGSIDGDQYESTTVKYRRTTTTTPITKTNEVHYTGVVGEDGVLRFEGLAAGNYVITEIKPPQGYNLLTTPINLKIDWTAPTAPATECIWTYTWGEVVGTNTIDVENNTGSTLPSTGGMGTTIFYIVGGVLVLVAVVLLVTRKRMKKEEV